MVFVTVQLFKPEAFDLAPGSRLLAVVPEADNESEEGESFRKMMSVRGSTLKELLLVNEFLAQTFEQTLLNFEDCVEIRDAT